MIVTLTMNPAVDISFTVERMSPGHKLRCSNPSFDPGGGGINVARVAKRLGQAVAAVFPAGGNNGGTLRGMLDSERVPYLALPVAGETRENINITETATGQEYRFVMPGTALSDKEVDACLQALRQVDRCEFLVVSGSLPPGLPDDFLRRLVPIARQLGAKLVVDTSGSALRQALGPGLFLIKPSLREMEFLANRPLQGYAEMISAARAIIASGGAVIVALTLGADGALLIREESCWHAISSKMNIVGTVGSGDSFLAGLLVSLMKGDAWDVACLWAVAAGAAAGLTPGTKLCQPDEIDKITELVSVSRLN